MNIYLVRHGESLSNINGTYCGKTDVPLTDNGLIQTKHTAEYLKTLNVDCVYTSPLMRTCKLAELTNKTVIYDERIVERNFGHWEGLSYKEIYDNYPIEARKWGSDWLNYRIIGGESCADVDVRCKEFIEEVIKNDRDCIVITHAGIIRNVTTILLGMKTEDVWRFKIDNGSVTNIEITDGYAVLNKLNFIP